jgi:type I restriction enzyme M protein
LQVDDLVAHLRQAVHVVGTGPTDRRRQVFLVSALLLLRRLSALRAGERAGVVVPRAARWDQLAHALDPARALVLAREALEARNPRLRGFLAPAFAANARRGVRWTGKARPLIAHFSSLQLDEAAADGALVAAAFERFLFTGRPRRDAVLAEVTVTPELAELVVALADPREGERLGDPACGYGSLLLAATRCAKGITLVGQDSRPEPWALAQIALVLNGLGGVDLGKGDVLLEELRDAQADLDVVVCCPPIRRRLAASWPTDSAERYPHGVPPPSRPDLAYVQRILASLGAKGRAVIVLPQGALFRGGAEERIRASLVDADLVEAVVELPSGSLVNANVAPVLLLLNRAKARRRRGKVLFVAGGGPVASDELVRLVRGFAAKPGLAGVVSIEELRARNYNLSVKRNMGERRPDDPGSLPILLPDLEKQRRIVKEIELQGGASAERLEAFFGPVASRSSPGRGSRSGRGRTSGSPGRARRKRRSP